MVLWVGAALFALSFFSKEFQIGGLTVKKMDIFGDIRKKENASLVPIYENSQPSFSTKNDSTPQFLGNPDSLNWGKIVEDFTPEKHGLRPFFAAIDSLKIKKNQVRVAFFGDSFVEGDILLGDLRDTLQSKWGGRGVGFVPMSSEVERFRRSYLQKSSGGWHTRNFQKNKENNWPFGIAGVVSQPEPDGAVRYDGNNYFKNTSAWGQVRLFYESEIAAPMVWQNLNQSPIAENLAASPGKLGVWKWKSPGGQIPAFAFRFPKPDSLLIFGASLEDSAGFYLDNFSVRGNTGGKIKRLDPKLMQQFDRELGYDLIIFQIGLNAVTPSLKNIPWYEIELDETFAHLRKCFPGKPILIFSVADRGGKVDGEIKTMIAVPAIVDLQRKLAQKHGFLFWDLFRGMGGEGTMLAFSKMSPSLANKDFTHLTHEGGKIMGHLVADLFFREQEKYQKKGD